MDDVSSTINDVNLPRAKRPGGFDETAHHQLVGFEEVFHLVGVDAFYRLVCRRRTQDLVNLPLRGDNLLPCENSGDLVLREGVSLDGG